MSQSILLIGEVIFKKGKTYDEVKETIHYFCKYSEVDEPDIIEQYDDTIKLIIQDINWISDKDVYTLNALEHVVVKYKDLIDNVGFSLYYLQKEDINLYIDKTIASFIDYVRTLPPDATFYCDCKYYKNEEDIKEFITSDVGRYYKELIKDGIIDERKLMLYKLKENEEEED